MKSKVLVFMPSIQGGGVEKNFFLVCNYLVRKLSSLKVRKYFNWMPKIKLIRSIQSTIKYAKILIFN